MVANQLMEANTTADITMDTRTPPRIKLHQKKPQKKIPESVENSHPGVAEPIDVDSFVQETSTQKRATIYRHKTPTTDSGISTWILLSGHSSTTTTKPVRKQTIKTTTSKPVNKTVTTTEKTVKSTTKAKPATKVQTTKVPITTTTTEATVAKKNQEKNQNNNRVMTKVKASVLNNAVNNKNNTVMSMSTTTASPTTIRVVTTVSTKQTTGKIKDNKKNITQTENTEPNELQPEAKDGGVDLPNEKSTTTKRPRRPANNNKRKKNANKNRRRKPAADNAGKGEKSSNAANSTKVAHKEKPFGTQIYNYLSREVMPTVGVGLVGLMVTAGLASYFLYPFGGLRRAYEGALDRKDYYSYDEYTPGGVAEEEVIGKVIAGMPDSNDYSNTYKSPSARKEAYRNDVNYNYRNSDAYSQYPSQDFQTVSVGSKLGYGRDVIAEHQKETGYTVDDIEAEKKQFVVGNVPKEFEMPVTPVAVPEHGPRNLRLRRQVYFSDKNEAENEIDYKDTAMGSNSNQNPPVIEESISTTNQPLSKEPTFNSTTGKPQMIPQEQPVNFFSFVRNLIELKVRVGLDFLVHTSNSVNKYLKGVQDRVETVLREQKNRTRN